MTSLAPITLDNGTVIYVQINEALEVPEFPSDEGGRVSKDPGEALQRSYETMKSTIKGYTGYVIDSFDEMNRGNIEKVTLEFGVTVGGKMGIPYITEGSTAGSLKVTVECTWPRQSSNPDAA